MQLLHRTSPAKGNQSSTSGKSTLLKILCILIEEHGKLGCVYKWLERHLSQITKRQRLSLCSFSWRSLHSGRIPVISELWFGCWFLRFLLTYKNQDTKGSFVISHHSSLTLTNALQIWVFVIHPIFKIKYRHHHVEQNSLMHFLHGLIIKEITQIWME